ncbi:MAG: CHC2 zinc finger domain-containing protein, partial [Candidatus Uhrbacteria bacterium]|nr:CHC2 zinc finger domain-containing protein [Candidatus Uhrbacteria bacterium]
MDAPEEIKSRLDIADLIGEYLPLKPAGSGAFKALCPCHQEKTPSFYVSRPRQSWHCFGCDQGGDHFSFVEKIEGMEFREVLELLAQKTGVVLPKFDQQKASARKRLQEVNDLAVRFLRSALAQLPQAEHARQYLKQRGVDDLTADLFKLGYAPSEWTALSDALIKNGVTADELIQAGLSIKSDRGNGVYDRFRDRVMFPIADVHGNVVGFT